MGKSSSEKRAVATVSPTGDEEFARGRLLGAATQLFCKNGINATGIDAIINEAGTAKTTLYKLFGSKTNLVHAVLETEGKQWREWFIAAIEAGGGNAQTKLARIFPALKDWFCQERFYGCPFINAVGEHDKEPEAASRHRDAPQEGRAGAISRNSPARWARRSPKVLAHQLALLMDGAIVAAMVSRDPGMADAGGTRRGFAVRACESKKAETRRRRGGAVDGGLSQQPRTEEQRAPFARCPHRLSCGRRSRKSSNNSDRRSATRFTGALDR